MKYYHEPKTFTQYCYCKECEEVYRKVTTPAIKAESKETE